ncbi:hypothetical protein [Craterilacuibacter sp.]|uniref:hypothetical protein n=1 Tax=Craterilacuibacter sp. TaxID=2870909 RepID=UPI003F38DAC8
MTQPLTPAEKTSSQTEISGIPGVPSPPAWWPRALSKAEFRIALHRKGWTLSDAAFVWGISLASASRIAANPRRTRHWLLALQALPEIGHSERLALRAARQHLQPPPTPKPVPVTPAAAERASEDLCAEVECFESVACHRVCGIAEEGDADGFIAEIRGDGRQLAYRVTFPAGEDWFPQTDFDRYFYTTGRILNAAERAHLTGEAHATE